MGMVNGNGVDESQGADEAVVPLLEGSGSLVVSITVH